MKFRQNSLSFVFSATRHIQKRKWKHIETILLKLILHSKFVTSRQQKIWKIKRKLFKRERDREGSHFVTLFQILSKTSTPSWTFFRTRSISPCNLRLAAIVQQFDHCQIKNYNWWVCFYYHSILRVINGRTIGVCRSLFLGFFLSFFLIFYSFRLLCWVKYGGDDGGEKWTTREMDFREERLRPSFVL